jgi:hypothetical protein
VTLRSLYSEIAGTATTKQEWLRLLFQSRPVELFTGVQMLKAMDSWYVAVPRFHEIAQTIKWINNLDLTGWNPDNSWKTDCLLPDEVIERLENIDVLGDYVWITSLRGRSFVELSCMDLALQALIHRYSGEHDIYAIPSHVMRFAASDREELKMRVYGLSYTLRLDG